MQFEHSDHGPRLPIHAERERRVVDAVVVDNKEVWLVVAHGGEDIASWLDDPEGEWGEPLRICRAVEDGMLIVGRGDSDRDALLSDLVG